MFPELDCIVFIVKFENNNVFTKAATDIRIFAETLYNFKYLYMISACEYSILLSTS